MQFIIACLSKLNPITVVKQMQMSFALKTKVTEHIQAICIVHIIYRHSTYFTWEEQGLEMAYIIPSYQMKINFNTTL